MKFMKRIIALFVVFFTAVLLVSCGKKKTTTKATTNTTRNSSSTTSRNTSSKKTSSKQTSSKQTTDKKTEHKFDDELAMANFVDKLDQGNYTVVGDDFSIDVCSDNLVTFKYSRTGYNDYTVMSVSGEVFQAFIKHNQLKNLTFIEYGNSLEACTKQALIPNYMTYLYGANMFDLFYNVPDEDGVYVSYSATLRDMLQRMGSYSDMINAAMEEVYLILDDEDPTCATLKTHVYNAVAYYDFDIVMDITFGNATENELAKEWLNNPILPNDPEYYNINQLGAISFVFNLYPDEPEAQGVPYIPGASYALYLDNNLAQYYDTIYLKDVHISSVDVENYKNVLVDTYGFGCVLDEDGDECFMKLLRAESNMYSRIYVDYTEGVGMEIVATPYYDCTKYDRTGINNIIIDCDYPVLPSNSNMISMVGTDNLAVESEAYLYINEYEIVLDVEAEFEDYESAYDYLESYLDMLEDSGFVFNPSSSDPRYDYHNGDRMFRYKIDSTTNTLLFQFKGNVIYDTLEILDKINNDDDYFPGFDLDVQSVEYYNAKDLSKHEYIVLNNKYDLYFVVNFYTEDSNTVDDFIDYYTSTLEGKGFIFEHCGVGKQYEMYDETTDAKFGFEVGMDPNSGLYRVSMVFAK
ncbi:MAG: hypothetical protein J6Y28_03310 [Acholeplasmatales bacterium]|nr:hypothetical protein [Acholeplasmatales bacterium]